MANGNGGKRNGREWVDLVALILTVTLCLILLITVVALLVFDAELGDEGGRLLSGIGLALAGALAAYIGAGSGRHRDGGQK